MLYINWKLSLRPFIASHKIFIKGLVHNLHKTGRCTLVQWYCFIQTILKSEENVGMPNIEMRNSPLNDMISRKSTFQPYCWSFSWFYEVILSIWRQFRISIWRISTISVISSHSEEPVANFNIANLYKNAEEFLLNKKTCPNLNL